jgi:hypothetical protein
VQQRRNCCRTIVARCGVELSAQCISTVCVVYVVQARARA